MQCEIPLKITKVVQKLEAQGFEAFLVGGCVRDLLLNTEPKDWDIATNAKPQELLRIFPEGKYENDFGTVMLPLKYIEGAEEKDWDGPNVEITTYRVESKYSDKRHPDEIKFAKTLEKDLSRRDFTINAMAIYGIGNAKRKTNYEIVDPFKGQVDLKNKIIQTVGKADERFNEDALRMMRAIRFTVTLKTQKNGDVWIIEKNTFKAIKRNAKNINYISKERIRDELEKIILSPRPAQGIELLHELGLLRYIIPELEIGYNVKQSHHHYWGPYSTVYKHLLASLEKCPSEKLEVRLAALFHDIGKPQVKHGKGETATFYNHEYVSARMVREILERLKFKRKIIEKTTLLVKNHMFYYNVDEVGESGVRRVIRKVGLENINDLIDVRIADRLGSGVPKAVPYKLRHFKFMVEKVSHDALSVKQLKVNGKDLMRKLKIQPGPKIGAILEILLMKVIDNSRLNDQKKLLDLAEKLNQKDLESLKRLAEKRIEQERKEEEELIKKKYQVK